MAYAGLTIFANSGCDAPAETTHDALQVTTQPRSSYAVDRTVARPDEEPLLEISYNVEAFSGYRCSNGDLIVGTTDSRPHVKESLLALPQIKNASRLCYNRDVGPRTPEILFEQQERNFLTLRSLRDTHGDTFFASGGHAIGIDYEANSLSLWVSAVKMVSVESFALQQLPAGSYRIIEEASAELTVACPPAPYNGPTVNNCFRPIPGGVQMRPTNNGGTAVLGGGCTLTAAIDRWIPQSQIWQAGFVTASHCLPPTSSMNSDWVHQADWVSPGNDQFIGVEFYDPPGWTCGSLRCRYSDSTFIWHYQGGVQHGTIAQTLGWNGNKTTSPTNPRFYVWDKTPAVQGMQVEKVGQASGWTTGLVTSVCVDTVASSINHKFICTGHTSLPVAGGDSGSPVFYWWWFHGVDTVEMIGVLWGSSNGNGMYSPWSNVELDLGSLYIKYPYF